MRLTFLVLISLILIAGLSSLVMSTPAATCPAVVEAAFAQTDRLCRGIGRNQACYGNAEITARPQPGATGFAFRREGDVVDANWIESMRLSDLDPDRGVWGVSLMRLQANLPDTLPGQNVTFLVFGDVEIVNGVEARRGSGIAMTAARPVGLYASPGAGPELTTIPEGASVKATGRLADESWFLVQTDAEHGISGWADAFGLMTIEDTGRLPVVDPAQSTPARNPLQAFYLRTHDSSLGCVEAPADGLLIQTPHGAGRISFQINGVNVELGSTVFVEAEIGLSRLAVTTLEGLAEVEWAGFVQYAVPGTTVYVPLDHNMIANSPPLEPIPYDPDRLRALPLGLLDRSIVVQPPLPAGRIHGALTVLARGETLCGEPPLAPCQQSVVYGNSVSPANHPPTANNEPASDPTTDHESSGGHGVHDQGNHYAYGHGNGQSNGNGYAYAYGHEIGQSHGSGHANAQGQGQANGNGHGSGRGNNRR